MPSAGRILLVIAALVAPATSRAQTVQHMSGRGEVFVGGEIETYLRALQLAGLGARYPWSIRGFSPAEVDRLLPATAEHPWGERYDLGPARAGLQVEVIPPTTTTIYNSGFPYGSNDGPIWAGRGVTAAVQMGFSARYGPVSLTVAPLAFSSSNAGFDLLANGRVGQLQFGDGLNPTQVDVPQRFGDGAYSRVDAGQSTLRVDLPVVTVGVSTANQQWGPATTYPIILGNNAAGFEHLFLGTSAPLDLWLFKVHGRMVWGELNQSEYSAASGAASRRFMSGLVAVITPRGMDGLEIGLGRFFHTPWPPAGLTLAHFTKPLETFIKAHVPPNPEFPSVTNEDLSNQLASAFARWVFPKSGFEVYAEYGRGDHNWDFRDILQEPDHSAAYMLGFQKTWRRTASSLGVVRAEIINLEPSILLRGRGQPPMYLHYIAQQGHTQRGQLLGANVGPNPGAGSIVAVDSWHARGRWTLSWSRVRRQDISNYWLSGVVNPRAMDVMHTLGGEGLFFVGRFDITAGLTLTDEFNRNFVSDAFNLGATLRVRTSIPRPVRR